MTSFQGELCYFSFEFYYAYEYPCGVQYKSEWENMSRSCTGEVTRE